MLTALVIGTVSLKNGREQRSKMVERRPVQPAGSAFIGREREMAQGKRGEFLHPTASLKVAINPEVTREYFS